MGDDYYKGLSFSSLSSSSGNTNLGDMMPFFIVGSIAIVSLSIGIGVPVAQHYEDKNKEKLAQVSKEVVEKHADADCDGLVSIIEVERFFTNLAIENGYIYRKGRSGILSYGFFKPDSWWGPADPKVSTPNQIEMFESYRPRNTAPIQTKNCSGKWIGPSYNLRKLR